MCCWKSRRKKLLVDEDLSCTWLLVHFHVLLVLPKTAKCCSNSEKLGKKLADKGAQKLKSTKTRGGGRNERQQISLLRR